MMKSFLSFLIFFMILPSQMRAQTENNSPKFLLILTNGISNTAYFDDTEDERKIAYVNAVGLYYSFSQSNRLKSFLGIQYNKNGTTTNFVCESSWDYCSTHGTPPIDVISINRFHSLSLVFNLKYIIKQDFYFRGGLSIDTPFNQSFSFKYTDTNNKKSKEQDWNRYGKSGLINTSFGANLTLGKSFQINNKMEWFAEIDFKMYNLIGIRFEDYEDYFLYKKEKPYAININIGLSLH